MITAKDPGPLTELMREIGKRTSEDGVRAEIKEFRDRMARLLFAFQPQNQTRDPENSHAACAECPGRCCTKQFGFQSMALTPLEAQMPEFSDRAFMNQWDFTKWSYPLGDGCKHLDESTRRCTIYERRPNCCRGFECFTQANNGHEKLRAVIAGIPEHEAFLRSRNLLAYRGAEDRKPIPLDAAAIDNRIRKREVEPC